MKKVKVLIIDDSALVRRMLTEILSSDPMIEVVGSAADPLVARDKIKQLNPDVLTLDVEMPKMDGITFLRNLMRLRPMPVIMISTLTEKGADVTLDALAIGAVDFISKPKFDLAHTFEDYRTEITMKVKHAAGAHVRSGNVMVETSQPVEAKLSADAVLKKQASNGHFRTTERIIAIGASTGGTEAIKEVLLQMPANSPGIVISQHIPEAFSASFAKRMDSICAMTVFEAKDGQQIMPGHVYIAPGNRHLIIVRDGARYRCQLNDGPPVNRHKPSVDVMFRSVAQNVGKNAIAAILTGMGDDGAAGLKEIRDTGAFTIAQDEKTSVVWGMPGQAVKADAVEIVLPLQKIPGKLLSEAAKNAV